MAVHIYTQTIHRTTQITTNLEDCGTCPIFASFILAFTLQLKKKHGKTSVRVRKTSEYSIHITRTPTHYKTYTHTHTYTLQNPHIHTHTTKPTHTHTLKNNIKPPQYKLKQTQCKLYSNEMNQERVSGTHWIGGLVVPIVGLHVLDKGNTSCFCRVSNYDFSVVQLVG